MGEHDRYDLPLDGASAARCIRATIFISFPGLSSCSQIRITLQPAIFRIRFTFRSRLRFSSNLVFQNGRLLVGKFACFGQTCQKQPSTKMAIRVDLITKSGFTFSLGSQAVPFLFELITLEEWFALFRRQWTLNMICLLHPVTWCRLRIETSASSVSLFPYALIRDITRDRFSLEKTSVIYGVQLY